MKFRLLTPLRGTLLALLIALAPPAFALEKARDASPPPPVPVAPAAPAAPDAPDASASDEPADPDAAVTGRDRVDVFSGNFVGANEHIEGNVVSVMGNTTVLGSVSHDVVNVLGNVYVNGPVGHNVTCAVGNVTLGPRAVVDGDVVAACGRVSCAPGAVIRGRIVGGVAPWRMARRPRVRPREPDAAWAPPWPEANGWRNPFGPGWPPGVARSFLPVLGGLGLALSVLLAFVFPNGIRRCGDVLARRPAAAVLASFLTLLALPILFVLLCLTVVGIPVAVLFIPMVLAGVVFGKASVYGAIGRGLCGARARPALTVLVGGLLCLLCGLFYLVPVAGICVSFIVGMLGLGCVVTVLLGERMPGRFHSPEPAPPVVPTPPTSPSAVPPVAPTPPPSSVAPGEPSASSPPMEPPPPPAPASPMDFPPALPSLSGPPPSVSGLPPPPASPALAGFWIRMGGLFIDTLIVGAIFGDSIGHRYFNGFHFSGTGFLLPLAAYAAIMWKLKGATVGGLVFGLKVIRRDGRPMEWDTAIIRALSCFLSMILCLGFIWIAFDPEKQSWHDKIAGTIVVKFRAAESRR